MEEVEGKNLEQVLESNRYVLVDFWAPWCGPCRVMAPVVDEIAEKYKGKIKVIKINVDSASDVAGKYGIMSIPTIILFENGTVKGKSIGAVTANALSRFIDNNINQ